MTQKITVFDGDIPKIYDRYLGPGWFEPFAVDLAGRVATTGAVKVLELACGTGILTQQLLSDLPGASIVATDLSADMLEYARAKIDPAGTRVAWHQADMLALPFGDASFDAVACQFGWMFLPDKTLAARETLRVLKPGGSLFFNVWDSLAVNDVARVAQRLLEERFPGKAPQFLALAFGCHDRAALAKMMESAGFAKPRIAEIEARGSALLAKEIATGIVLGLPIRHSLQARRVDLNELVDELANRLAGKFGDPPKSARLQAVVVSATA